MGTACTQPCGSITQEFWQRHGECVGDPILRNFIQEQFAEYYDNALANLTEERKQAA